MRSLATAILLFSNLVYAGDSDSVIDADVLGTWVSEPVLGQLGRVQSSFTFQRDGSVSLRQDFISFCDGRARLPDCDYFRIFREGRYTYHDGVINITDKTEKRVLLLTGQREPEITENILDTISYDILVERLDDSLLIRESENDEAAVFRRED